MAPSTGQLLTHESRVQTAPKWSFPGRQSNDKESKGPGPGAYCPGEKMSQFKAASYGFGTCARAALRGSSAPGPGAYGATLEKTKLSAPNYGFGSSTRDRAMASTAPGPGAYVVGKAVEEGPKHSMTPRRELASSSRAPGPGAYGQDADLKEGAPKYGFGTSGRPTMEKSSVPGPGTYVGTQSEDGVKHSMTPRREASRAQHTPGPGAYKPATSGRCQKDTPKWGFGTSGRAGNSKGFAPGPGAYAPDINSVADHKPAYSMRSRDNVGSKVTTPGPGAYAPGQGEAKDAAPKWGFGTSDRAGKSAAATPGPGAYVMGGHAGDGPQFSMTPRRDEADKKSVPGPGAYAQDVLLDEAAPKYAFGTSERANKMASTAPGPGSYQFHSTVGNDTPSYSVRGRHGSREATSDGAIGVSYTQFGY